MQEKKEFIAGGFQFSTQKDVSIAKKEVRKIELLESRMNYTEPEQVYAVYEGAIQNRVFETPVGYTYLYSLRTYLLEHPLEEKEISSIPLYINYSQTMRGKSEPAKKRIEPAKIKTKRIDRLKTSIFINILLVIMVIVMFSITLMSKNPNILNYQSAILNKYASWEQELTKRESIIREKERELDLSK